MPIIEQNPGWANAISALIAGFGLSQQARQAKAEQQRQAKLDADTLATNAAMRNLYGAEASRNTEQSALDQANIGKAAAYNRSIGESPSGQPLNVDTRGIQLQPSNKGKKSAVTREQQYAHLLAGYQAYAKAGVNDQHNPFYQPLKQMHDEDMAEKKAQEAANLAGVRYEYQKKLKGVPTYGNLHRVGRAATPGADVDTVNAAEKEISKSRNPKATAAHWAEMATVHGAKKPTIDAINDLGTYYEGKTNTTLTTRAQSNPFAMPK